MWVDAQFPGWRPKNSHGKHRRPKPIYATSSDIGKFGQCRREGVREYRLIRGHRPGRPHRPALGRDRWRGWSVDAMTIPWKDLRRAVEDNDVAGARLEHPEENLRASSAVAPIPFYMLSTLARRRARTSAITQSVGEGRVERRSVDS